MSTHTSRIVTSTLCSTLLTFVCAGGTVVVVGCDDGSSTTGSSASSSSSSSSSSGSGGGAGEGGGGGSGNAGGSGGVGGAGGSVAQPAVTMIPLSEMGHDRFLGVTHDPQGNIYVTGTIADTTDATADVATIVGKFSPSGEPDMSFGVKGFARQNLVVGTNGEAARGIVVQSSGKVVIAATVDHPGAADARDRDIAAARFNTDGTLDTTFGTNGIATFDLSDGELVGTTFIADTQWGLSLHTNDGLIITGAQKAPGRTDLDFAVLRLNADGKLDATFGTSGVTLVDINQQTANPRNATILPDSSIVIAGYTRDMDGIVSPVLFKLTAAGQLDPTFGANGIFNQIVLGSVTEAYAATLQGTNFVTAGYGRNSAAESLDWLSLRISGDGKLDNSYGENGVTKIDVQGFNDNARSLVALGDNRLLLVGGGRKSTEDSDAMIGILTPEGKIDTTFDPKGFKTFDLGGATDFFWAVDLSPDKKTAAIVGGSGMAAGAGDDDAALLLLPIMP